MRGWVYALVDPSSIDGGDLSEVRYVGYSYDPNKRMLSHLREAKRNVKGHRCNWLRQLISMDVTPVLWLLEEADYNNLPALEMKWIADLKQCYSLVNGTDGGDGVIGYVGTINVTPEGREKQGRAASAARKKEIAEGRVLSIHSPEARKKAVEKLRGYKHSIESKASFSEGAKQRFLDPLERKKISDAMVGVPKSEEHKNKLAEAARKQMARAVKKPCPACGVTMIQTALGMHRKAKGH